MLAMAMSGLSSVNRLIDRCPWAKWGENGTLIVTLVFDTYEAAMGVFWFKQTPAGAAAMGLTVPSLSCGCETTV